MDTSQILLPGLVTHMTRDTSQRKGPGQSEHRSRNDYRVPFRHCVPALTADLLVHTHACGLGTATYHYAYSPAPAAPLLRPPEVGLGRGPFLAATSVCPAYAPLFCVSRWTGFSLSVLSDWDKLNRFRGGLPSVEGRGTPGPCSHLASAACAPLSYVLGPCFIQRWFIEY